jgi:hypothetical protein
LEDDTCFLNKGVPGPEGCARPCPELLLGNAAVWKLFRDTSGYVVWRGMDGQPTARLLDQVESLARSRSVAWDETTTMKYLLIEQFWLAEFEAQLKIERAKLDKK